MFNTFFLFVFSFLIFQQASATAVWMEIQATTVEERTALASEGYDIVSVEDDRVIVLGSVDQLAKAKAKNILLAQYGLGLSPFDFPQADQKFYNYQEMTIELEAMAAQFPELATLTSLGSTVEQRQIWMMRLSVNSDVKPAAVFMGGHHAREHVSMEIPVRLIRYLLEEYEKKNPRVVSILNNYEVFIIPRLNADGADFDVATGSYRSWRKNRTKNSDGVFGVDLNRNYGYGWGGAGASVFTKDETYRGPSAFSEPETQAIKSWIEQTPQISVLLSYHTFSQLVMWPWGHLSGKISEAKDLNVFETMGKKMAAMTGYRPMKSGDLYLASGDTCDWAYGEHGIFAFTFELDPRNFWDGGFYPGYGIVEQVFQKNIEPALYLIESADNPYKHAL